MSREVWGYLPDHYCQMCGYEAGSCICEECPICGQAGDPECYERHGMEETEEQIQGRIRHSPVHDDWTW